MGWTTTASAQTTSAAANEEGGIIGWLEDNGISIRKTFDGKSKEEAEPARVTYNDTTVAGSYWLVDLGVKFSEWDLCSSASAPGICKEKSVIVYPIVEWHRSTNALEESHKFKLGPAVDFLWGDLTKRPVLITLLKVTYERDVKNDVNSGNGSALFGVKFGSKSGGGNTWLPMSHINDANGNLILRYAPYFGIERYNNLAIEKKNFPTIPGVSLTDMAFHMQVDFYPFNSWSGHPGWFEIIGTTAVRWKIGGDENVDDTLVFNSVGANVYFDKARHFAVGLDWENGRKPGNNFDRQHSTSVGIKVKF